MIFRKVADVIREKELAERNKNDPPMEFAEDHPVRKLISRLRKQSCTRMNASVNIASSDVQESDDVFNRNEFTQPNNNFQSGESVDQNGGKTLTKTEPGRPNPFTRNASPSSKWGKLLQGVSSTDDGTSVKPAQPLTPLNNSNNDLVQLIQPKPGLPRSPPTAKFSNLKLFQVKNEAFECSPESEEVALLNNRKKDWTLRPEQEAKIELKYDNCQREEDQKEGLLRTQRNPREVGSSEEMRFIAGLNDIRVELSEELGELHKKLNTIDRQLERIVSILQDGRDPWKSRETVTSELVDTSAVPSITVERERHDVEMNTNRSSVLSVRTTMTELLSSSVDATNRPGPED